MERLPWKSDRKPLPSQARECGCSLCIRGRYFEKQIKRLSPKKREYFEHLYELLLNTEEELEMCRMHYRAETPA